VEITTYSTQNQKKICEVLDKWDLEKEKQKEKELGHDLARERREATRRNRVSSRRLNDILERYSNNKKERIMQRRTYKETEEQSKEKEKETGQRKERVSYKETRHPRDFKVKERQKLRERVREKIAQDKHKKIQYIYTDGAVSNNKRGHKHARGGIGVYFGHKNDPRNISELFQEGDVTNQRAEVWALVKALEVIRNEIDLDETKVIIYSDSMYAINVITRQWNAKDNLDLIRVAWKLIQPGIVIKHIRAHSGKKDVHSIGNAWADKLANMGKTKSHDDN